MVQAVIVKTYFIFIPNTFWDKWLQRDTNHNHLVRKRTFNHLVRLNGWVFLYQLNGSGFEYRCCHLNFRYCSRSEQGVPWHLGSYRVWIWHDKNTQIWSCFREFVNIIASQFTKLGKYQFSTYKATYDPYIRKPGTR